MPEISFNSLEEDFILNNSDKIEQWLNLVCKNEGSTIQSLDYIFVTDAYLLEINQKYLDHDTFTDIITFNLGDDDTIEGEIYISVERTRENAKLFKVDEHNELNRVIVHGLLHLIGYNDHTEEDKNLMRNKENKYLSLLSSLK